MPQEVSVSYQAVKSKVYRLIDALVVGEKTEADVQESIRRWWELIHPADRPKISAHRSGTFLPGSHRRGGGPHGCNSPHGAPPVGGGQGHQARGAGRQTNPPQ